MNYICIGQHCSPATALRYLNLRAYALPFDWIRSSPEILSDVISDDFKGFHEGLQLSENKQYIIDSYGLEYPHDYPTIKNESDEFGENVECIIIESWKDFIPEIQEKYKRRIERFQGIMNSSEPVIALFIGEISGISKFKEVFLKKYNKTNIFYVVLSEEIIDDLENQRLLEEGISLCEPEEILIDENDRMFICKIAQSKLWHDAIKRLKI